MKQELNEGLGFHMDQIKSMTPLQASLVLHHQIKPEGLEERLPIVEKEYQEQKEIEQKQRQAEIQQQEEQRQHQLEMQKQQQQQLEQKQAVEEQPPSSAPSSTNQQPSTPYFDPTFWYMSTNTLNLPNRGNNIGWGDTWFEVVETNHETEETSRVGLYQDEKEAELGMQVRQEIAETKGRPSTFEMHSLDKNHAFS